MDILLVLHPAIRQDQKLQVIPAQTTAADLGVFKFPEAPPDAPPGTYGCVTHLQVLRAKHFKDVEHCLLRLVWF